MFPTTSWTLVAKAASPDASRSAMEDLCTTYWQPVYSFIRAHVHDREQAKDLTQAFFTRLIEKHDLLPAQGLHSRFRFYLLSSVKHFLSNERDRERAGKRGGSHTVISINFDDPGCSLPMRAIDTLTPERVFEKHWAEMMLRRALHVLRHEFAAEPGHHHFEVLKVCLTSSEPGEHYRDLGAGIGMSEAAVKSAVHRMRQRFGETLRTEIARTVTDPNEVEDELRYLFAVVSS